jgi:hypothetical protein
MDKKLWNHLRIAFWIWVLTTPVLYVLGDSSLLVIIATTIYVFVQSIRHLRTYEEKPFAVVALVLSSIMLLILIVSFLFVLLVWGDHLIF